MDTPIPSLGLSGSSGDHPELPAMSKSRQVSGGMSRSMDTIPRTANPVNNTSPPAISRPLHSATPAPTVSSIHSASPALTHSVQSSSPGLTHSMHSTSTGVPQVYHSHNPSVPELMNSNTNLPQMTTSSGYPMAPLHELPNGTHYVNEFSPMHQRQGTIHELPIVSSPVQHIWYSQPMMAQTGNSYPGYPPLPYPGQPHPGLANHGVFHPGFVNQGVPQPGMPQPGVMQPSAQQPGVPQQVNPYEMPTSPVPQKQASPQINEVQPGYPVQ